MMLYFVQKRTRISDGKIEKAEVLNATTFIFGKLYASRSGENNAEMAAAIPNIVDTPTVIVFILIIS